MSKCSTIRGSRVSFLPFFLGQSEPEVLKRTLELTVLRRDVKFLRHLINNQSLDVNGKPKDFVTWYTHTHAHTHMTHTHTSKLITMERLVLHSCTHTIMHTQ